MITRDRPRGCAARARNAGSSAAARGSPSAARADTHTGADRSSKSASEATRRSISQGIQGRLDRRADAKQLPRTLADQSNRVADYNLLIL
jgi:hypothetical protein